MPRPERPRGGQWVSKGRSIWYRGQQARPQESQQGESLGAGGSQRGDRARSLQEAFCCQPGVQGTQVDLEGLGVETQGGTVGSREPG